MSQEVKVYTEPPAKLIKLLTKHHLPHSLPLLRRLQFTRFPGGLTEHSHILYASNAEYELIHNLPSRAVFAAAYVDLSRGPETEMWLYSSLEHYPDLSAAELTEAEDCVLNSLREVKSIRDRYLKKHERPLGRAIFVGNLNVVLKDRLEGRGVVFVPTEGLYDKWLFNVDELPLGSPVLEEGMRWGKVRKQDIPLVLSRTKIPRQERTVVLLPSTAIILRDGTPIAWCFLGPDGSLASLHCEEPYRGRGYAKAVAVKIFQENLKDFGDDGIGTAEVAPNNLSSQGVCRSLGGKAAWTVSWNKIDLDQNFPET